MRSVLIPDSGCQVGGFGADIFGKYFQHQQSTPVDSAIFEHVVYYLVVAFY